MDNKLSQKEMEHEALLNRARKYVADEQAKKQTEVTTDNKVSTKNEQTFTTREERMAEVMPRAQEFVKKAKNETVAENNDSVKRAAEIMGLDETYIRGPGEKPIQYPYAGFAHPEKIDPSSGTDGFNVRYAADFEDALLGYLGHFDGKENVATSRVDLNQEITAEDRHLEEERLSKSHTQQDPQASHEPAKENSKIVENVSKNFNNVTDKVSQKIGDVTDVVKDKTTEYKDDPSKLGKDIGDGIGNMLSSFAKGLNSLGEKISSYAEDPKTLGQDVQNGAKSVASKTEETISSGASLFSLDALKSGFNKVDTFLQEQQAKNDEIAASRKNDRNMP